MEAVTSDSLNRALQSAYNASSFGRSGCLLSVGSIAVSGSTVTANNIKVALPSLVFENTDETSQVLNGVEITLGSISQEIAIGDTALVTATFSKVNNTDDMYEEFTRIYSGAGSSNDYDFFVRTNELASVVYDEAGTISVGLFYITNVGGSDYEIANYLPSTSVVPEFCSVPNITHYDKLTSYDDNLILPYKTIKAMFDALGTMAAQDADAVAITGGTVANTNNYVTPENLTASLVITSSDMGKLYTAALTDNITITVNDSSVTDFEVGASIELFWKSDTGSHTITFAQSQAQTIIALGSDLRLEDVGSKVNLMYLGSDTWALSQVVTPNSSVDTIDIEVIIKTPAALSGALDSSKVYVIDGEINMGDTEILIPTGGLTLKGLGSNVSKLYSSSDAYTMFTDGTSGDIYISGVTLEVTGTGSQVFDVTGSTGNEAIEMLSVNFNDCTSLGEINGFRQGLEENTGRFGGTPQLTFSGTWTGGYRIGSSIVRNLDSGFSGNLFAEGTSLEFSSRFFANMNIDLPASAAIADFQASNFAEANLFQFQQSIVTRQGAYNPTDANYFPNISEASLEAYFVGNVGALNTFPGGKLTISASAATNIAATGTFVNVAGTYTLSEETHFDEPSNGQLRNISYSPVDFQIYLDASVIADSGDVLRLRIMKYDSSATTSSIIATQTRVVNNLVGGDDIAFFNIDTNVRLEENDYVYLTITNDTDTGNITMQDSSYISIRER